MVHLIIFLIILIVLYCSVTCLVPLILSWYIRRKYKLETRIGNIHFFSLHNVDIVKNGFSIHIDKIGFRSSFLSSEVTKLLCLVINEVRVNKDIVYNTDLSASSTTSSSSNNKDDVLRHNDISFHNQKIPPIIITFAQFLAVHIRTITAMFLRPESPEWLLHATASDVQLDGSLVRSAKTLLVNVMMASASARLLRHAPSTPVTVSGPNKPRPASCLCEMSVALSLEVTLIAQGPLSVEKVYMTTEQMKIVVNNGLYSFIQQCYQSETKSEQRSESKKGRISYAYNLMHHFSPVIPKITEIKLVTSSLMGMKDNIHTEIDASLDTFSVKTCFVPNDVKTYDSDWNIQWPHMSLGLSLGRLKVKSNKDKIISLKEFVLESKLEGRNMTIASLVNCLSTVYKHKDVHSWLITNFGYLSTSPKVDSLSSPSDGTEIFHVEETRRDWWNYLNIEISVQMFNVLSYIRLHPDFLCGFNDVKFLFTCKALSSEAHTENGISEFQAQTYPSSPVYWRQNWSCELLLKCGWGNLNYEYDIVNSAQFKKCHFWGFPVVVETYFVKIINCTTTKTVEVQAMINNVRLEWSPPLASFLHQAYKCLTDYYLIKKFDNRSSIEVGKSNLRANKFSPDFVWSLKVDNSNIFCIAERKVCIMARIDSITVSSDKLKLKTTLEGVKVASLLSTKHYHVCTHSDDIKSYCLKVNAADLERTCNSVISIQLRKEIHAHWSANLHLKLLTLFDDVMETFNNISGTHNSPEIEQPESKPSSSLILRNIKIFVPGNFIVSLKVSPKRHVTFSTDQWRYKKINDEVRLDSPMFKIAFDNRNIFFVENFVLQTLCNDETVRTERANAEDFTLPWNDTWEINIHSLKAVFPYEHEFSKTFHDDFLSVFKWLKLIHNKSKKGKNAKLPSDFVIKISEFLFEMSDDPFEVSLRDSYELLVDEYDESIKRQKILDGKLVELRKNRLLLPAGKLEEMHASLQEINARVYIQRSKQMKLQSPVRTRLFAWVVSDLQILSLADPSISGAENVVRIMTNIDPESPWPEEGIEFTTLWCRWISVSCKEWKFQLRDFRQPWVDIRELQLWGKLVGAEQEATKRAKRSVEIELGEPYANVTIERSMTSLKFYHDLNCEVKYFSYAFGPCWEPVISQCNIAFSKIVSSSKDPSPSLPFWDKIRLIYHGRLTMIIRQLTVLLHASLDPYNTTEEMEVTWNDVEMDWTNAKFIFKGDLQVYVRTASKYDDCRMLYLPNLKLAVKLKWICLGDPNDHHSVMPCAPNKLPEYSSNQEHDSFRAFRSESINLSLSLETKPLDNNSKFTDSPVALLYGSTLRWFENLKLILSGVTRPTRRGLVFNNSRPCRLPLSRHYKKVHLSLALHRFQVHYWMSFSMQRGLELFGQRFSFSSEYMLTLVPVDDNLRHRPRAVWSTIYMNCDLNDAEVWLKSALHQTEKCEILSIHQPVEKCYFLSVGKVSYGREACIPGPIQRYGGNRQINKDDTPTHRLVVYRLKGAWTASNRDIIFALYDSFRKTQQLKKNLSTAALKGFRCGDSSTPVKSRSRSIENPPPTTAGGSTSVQTADVVVQETLSPLTKLQSGHAASMLQQLIAEAENKAVVFSDDLSVQMREQHLQGLAVCQEDDVLYKNWLIALVNSQVLLKGCETKGYVIMSAAKAEILQRIHKPVWKDRTLVSKATWVGSLESMQYYATVNANNIDSLNENIMWLSVENIQEAGSTMSSDLREPHVVGSGQSVGGVVGETVGALDTVDENAPLQLQRIVSRCKCEFFYAGYGESSIDPTILDEVPAPPTEEVGTPWERQDKAVDAFTLMHHDLDVCTNSLQYAMVLDIVNNLLLYVEPRRKEAFERLQRMRFQLQLHSVQDQRKPIQQLQNSVRCLVAKLRKLEREMYLVQKMVSEDVYGENLSGEIEHLDAQMNECKDELNASSDELDMMLSCYKETQLSANQKLETLRGDKPITSVRTSEICFKHAQWRLTETDGQLGIADLVLSNFLYTKVSKSDDSVEHLLELGYIRMTNLLANEIYREVVVPTEIQSNMPIARKRAVRIFCREKAPVGGISVKEHFEINVVPFTIGLTKKFYDTMFKFCFPKRDIDYIDPEELDDPEIGSSTNGSVGNVSRKGKSQVSTEKSAGGKKRRETSFYVPIEMKDDVEKMKERAEKNKLFIYIKIPEVPVRVSYKGNKEKNLQDIRDFSLVIPTLEYHNVTWTWLDLFLAMKTDSRRVILSQAIKQKLQIKVRTGCIEEGSSPQEEDKARMLFGSRLMPSENKPAKKSGGIFKIPK